MLPRPAAWLLCCSAFGCALCVSGGPLRGEDRPAALPAPLDRPVEFVRDVQPIFARQCYDCHGPETQESGLRLDRRERALAGGDSGRVIVPGQSADSPLIKRVSGLDAETVMPPDTKGLGRDEVALLRAWIDQGADWPQTADAADDPAGQHWSYRPLERPPVPEIDGRPWGGHPIDAFVLKQLRAAGVQPSPEADRYTLIRRLHLDLLGLPPTPEDVDAFVHDPSPDAYSALVERLLASPHFGERWARHWLDKARYADSDGYEKDNPRPNAWRWRDWVIDAVNRDMPYDQFTIEQIAGDLLPAATPLQRLATGFHRQTLTNTEGGTDQEEFRVEAVFDRVETTGAVWLGLTIGCARCHSHKYDAITQREYYQVFAFYNNGDETAASVPISDQAVREFEAAKARHDEQVRQLQERFEEARQALGPVLAAWEARWLAAPPGWTPLRLDSAVSAGGATLSRLEDESWLVSGKNPETDVYTLEFALPVGGVTGLRLEALPHEALPARGPGRVEHGNFVLSEFTVQTAEDGQTFRPVPLSLASADWEQGGREQPAYPAAATIDGNPRTGWAVGAEYGRAHQIVFETARDLAASGERGTIRVRLVQDHGQKHTLGRFRLCYTASARPVLHESLPEPIVGILAVAEPDRNEAQRRQLRDWYAGIDPGLATLRGELAALKARAPKSPYMDAPVIVQRTSHPRQTHMLRRGNFLEPTDPVEPATLSVLPPVEPREPGQPPDRLDFARWLVSPRNPLTPRVAANQVWQHLFGQGLVRTPGDFGVRGEPPTHPELLDWLASEFIRLGWSRKQFIKTIVTSGTYRQSSRHRPELAELDPNNRLLARQNRFRVEGEIVRDLSLAVAGLLCTKIGGPSVFPPMPADVAALSYANNFKWTESPGEDRYRRGMYTFFKRTAPHPNLITFDCPDSNTTKVERDRSNTPLQALVTLNNEVFVEAAQGLARRVLQRELPDDRARLTLAFRLCVARPPSSFELARFTQLLQQCRSWYAERAENAQALAGKQPLPGVSAAETAAWVATARIMLNLDETITRE